MRRNRRISGFFFSCLAALATGACDELSSPTDPDGGFPPAATDLTGTWAGTVTVTYDPGEGECTEPASATFEQIGQEVRATLTDSPECGAACEYDFEGSLHGLELSGYIVFPDFVWPTNGNASEDHLTISSMNVYWNLHR